MPVTFNSNNNYSVDIVTEPDVLNPTVIKYSSDTNTPFIEIKITPDIFQYPLIAGNLNFDSLYRFIDWRAESTNGVNGNVNNSCTPIPTPHGVRTTNTFGVTTFPGTLANGLTCSLPQVTNNVTESFQGPYQSERNGAIIYGDLLADGVAWTKVIWVEVYEDDNGQMINEDFSPKINEDLASWQLWRPNNNGMPITNNVHPMYIRAFVFLEYGPNGPGGLSNNINIQIDIDENTPIYGCTDPNATNYYAGATVDDGSCTFAPIPRTIYIQDSEIVHSGPLTGYTDPPFPSQVPSDDGFSPGTLDLSGQPNMPKNLKLSPNNQPLANTYMPGDFVSEIISLVITPRSEDILTGNFQTDPITGIQTPIIESAYAAFDFPLPNGPNNQDMTDPQSFLGDAVNNLTAAGLYIENISTTTGSAIGRNTYVANGTSGLNSSNTSEQPNWMPDVGFLDEDGLLPRTICDWVVNDIEFIQPDGTIFTADINGLWVEEQYMAGSPLVPGLEWFPLRLNMYMVVEFTMPNHDVYLNLDLRHDTQRLAQN